MEVSLEERQRWQQRPDESPVMYQTWRDLGFIHWKYEPEVVQDLLPPGLHVDTFDGSAWVALVPFLMRNIHPWWFPSVPYISNFLELNLRTYVYDDQGRPGVYFTSLSANRWLAVQAARKFFHLPYHHCQMKQSTDSEGVTHYSCKRFSDPHQNTCTFRYRPKGGPAEPAVPGTLEFFLAERYLLFTSHPKHGLVLGQVHHEPYRVQQMDLLHYCECIFELDDVQPPRREPDHLLFSPGVDVDVFGIRPVQ